MSIGNATVAGNAGSVALGDAAVIRAAATRGLALGSASVASVANSVALGAGSTTAADTNVPNTAVAGTTYQFAVVTPATAGAVSVGAAGAERQLQNVAAGRLTGTSTDAVNGPQLFASNTQVSANAANLGNTTAAGLGGGSAHNPATGALTAPTYNVYGAPQTGVGGVVAALQALAPVQSSAATALSRPTSGPSIDAVQGSKQATAEPFDRARCGRRSLAPWLMEWRVLGRDVLGRDMLGFRVGARSAGQRLGCGSRHGDSRRPFRHPDQCAQMSKNYLRTVPQPEQRAMRNERAGYGL